MMQINQRAGGPAMQAPLKHYLENLGTFIGGLTLAINRPITSLHLDLKQILYEGYDQDKLKPSIIFVCRILKECTRSVVFKPKNPFLLGLLVFLKELYVMLS